MEDELDLMMLSEQATLTTAGSGHASPTDDMDVDRNEPPPPPPTVPPQCRSILDDIDTSSDDGIVAVTGNAEPPTLVDDHLPLTRRPRKRARYTSAPSPPPPTPKVVKPKAKGRGKKKTPLARPTLAVTTDAVASAQQTDTITDDAYAVLDTYAVPHTIPRDIQNQMASTKSSNRGTTMPLDEPSIEARIRDIDEERRASAPPYAREAEAFAKLAPASPTAPAVTLPPGSNTSTIPTEPVSPPQSGWRSAMMEPNQHPSVRPSSTFQNPQQFDTNDGQSFAVLIEKLGQLSVNMLARTRAQRSSPLGGDERNGVARVAAAGGGGGPSDNGDSRETATTRFVQSNTALFSEVLKLIEQYIPPPASIYRASDNTLPSIPTLPRAYFQPYFREPIEEWHERGCCYGPEYCHGARMVHAHNNRHGTRSNTRRIEPFVPREFHPPEIAQRIDTERAAGKSFDEIYAELERAPCLLCARALTSTLVCKLGSDFESSDYDHVVQSHGNFFDREGEYNSKTARLLSGSSYHGLLKPIVRFDRSHYTLTTVVVQINDKATRTVHAWAENNTIIFFSGQQRAHHAALNVNANIPPQVDHMNVAAYASGGNTPYAPMPTILENGPSVINPW